MEHGLEVRIWGTRGSLAAPYEDRMQFGGNTSCVSVRWPEGLAVFDCGTGLHGLGSELMRQRADLHEIHLFIGHVHLDHICALPFFPLLFQKDWKIHIYGSPVSGETFRETIGRVVGPPFWPITMEQAVSEIVWHDLLSGQTVKLSGGVVVKTAKANHGAGALLFRIERGGSSFVYGLDHEVTPETKASYCEFVKDCDLLLFDGMYTDEEYVRCRGFGHSTWTRGPEIAEECNVGTVCITHHDWARTDAELEEMERAVKMRNERCLFAREGMAFHLSEDRVSWR